MRSMILMSTLIIILAISMTVFAKEKNKSADEQGVPITKLYYKYVGEDENMTCYINFAKAQSGGIKVAIEKCVQKNDMFGKSIGIANVASKYMIMKINCSNNTMANVMGELHNKKGKLIRSSAFDLTSFIEIPPGTVQSRYKELVCEGTN